MKFWIQIFLENGRIDPINVMSEDIEENCFYAYLRYDLEIHKNYILQIMDDGSLLVILIIKDNGKYELLSFGKEAFMDAMKKIDN